MTGSAAASASSPGALVNTLTVGTAAAANRPVRAADDHADGSGSATGLTVGSPAVGLLERADDADWFVVTLAAGTRYEASLAGPGAARLTVLASDGATVLASNATSPREPVAWQASGGASFLRVEAVAGPVDYALVVEPRSAP